MGGDGRGWVVRGGEGNQRGDRREGGEGGRRWEGIRGEGRQGVLYMSIMCCICVLHVCIVYA